MEVLTLSAGVQALPRSQRKPRIATGVGVDQNLISVESVSGGCNRPIDAVRIVDARLQTTHKAMP